MEFSQVVRRRRMVRRYDGRPVPEELVQRALAHAVRAPNAGFSQGWDFLVLTTGPARDRFWRACSDDVDRPDGWLAGMLTAPVLVVCLSDEERYRQRYTRPDKTHPDEGPDGREWPVAWWDVDTGMAALLVLLTAVDEGLAGCFFGVPPGRWPALREAFGVPAGRRPVGVVSLGYPAAGHGSRPLGGARRPLAEVVHRERFGGH